MIASSRRGFRAGPAAGFLLLLLLGASATDERAPRISYELGLEERSSHIFNVTMTVDHPDRDVSLLELPVWQPGYYGTSLQSAIISFRAADGGGKALSWRAATTWQYQVETKGVDRLVVTYRAYAPRESVGTANDLNRDWGSFNGTRLFLYLRGEDGYPEPGPVALHVSLPAGWRIS